MEPVGHTVGAGFDFHRDIRHGLRLRECRRLLRAEHAAAATKDLMDMELTLAMTPPIRGARSSSPVARLMGVGHLRPPLPGTCPLNPCGIAHPVSVVSADDVARARPPPT